MKVNDGLLFTKAHKAVRARIYHVLDEYHLTPTDWSILSVTAQAAEGIRLINVASQLDVKAPMVTTEAAHLINLGLIRRVQHHSDKRAKLLVVTAKGKRLSKLIEQQLETAQQQMLKGLNDKEIATFQKVLETLIHNLNS